MTSPQVPYVDELPAGFLPLKGTNHDGSIGVEDLRVWVKRHADQHPPPPNLSKKQHYATFYLRTTQYRDPNLAAYWEQVWGPPSLRVQVPHSTSGKQLLHPSPSKDDSDVEGEQQNTQENNQAEEQHGGDIPGDDEAPGDDKARSVDSDFLIQGGRATTADAGVDSDDGGGKPPALDIHTAATTTSVKKPRLHLHIRPTSKNTSEPSDAGTGDEDIQQSQSSMSAASTSSVSDQEDEDDEDDDSDEDEAINEAARLVEEGA
jgi:hypothetical protein